MGHGFVDPFALMARLQRFAQPSEVAEPIELLRAGVAMHARGLINSRVIQNNLDWIWPYWVCRQVDPADPSFLPRAFSLTQINLTHRNWTAVGLPDCIEMPIVDPRGLVTPLLDGWSVDAWILADDGRKLFPSRTTRCGRRSCQPYRAMARGDPSAYPGGLHGRRAARLGGGGMGHDDAQQLCP